MKSLTFEYGGFHFFPFMKLTGAAGYLNTMAMAYNHKTPLLAENSFSHADFYAASPIKYCNLFKCVENGKIYIPNYNLHEYTGELHGVNPVLAKKPRDNER